MSSILIRPIESSSAKKILQFINGDFVKVNTYTMQCICIIIALFLPLQTEPLSESMGGILNSQASDLEVVGLALSGLSFEAIDTVDGKEEIVGAFLCTTHEKGEPHPLYEKIAQYPMDEKFTRIIDLTDYAKLLAEPTIRGKYHADEYLEGVMLSVLPSHSGRGIAKELIKAVEKHAEAKDIKLVYVGCSSEFTAKVMQKLGYEGVAEVPYEDYKRNGKQMFDKVKSPHVAYKVFIKYLGN